MRISASGARDKRTSGVDLSEKTTRRRGTSEKARQRQRGPRNGVKRRSTVLPDAGAATAPGDVAVVSPRLAASRSRREPAMAASVVGLSRDQEFAYIRSDMRRLLYVAGGLLALMLVILVFVGR
jgi:hypothetical protein